MNCWKCGKKKLKESKYCNNCGAFISKDVKNNSKNNKYIKESKYIDTNKNKQLDNKENDLAKLNSVDDYIYDRKKPKSKSKSKNFLIRLVLILTLVIVFIASFYIVEIASSSNKDKLRQAEIEKEQQIEREKEMEELKALEDYQNKFDSVLNAFSEQKTLIDGSLESLGSLKLNKFGKKLNFGDSFNNFVNKVFDNSSVNKLVSQSEVIDLQMKELGNPPESFDKKYKNMQKLQSLEKRIKDEFYPEVNKDTEENVVALLDEYKVILFSLKEN